MPATIVWFRQDLRLEDNEALGAAMTRGVPVVPVYVLDEAGEGRWPLGAASRSWLHCSLAALDASLRERGSRLILARGDASAELRRVARVVGADVVHWTRRYEPAAVKHDATVAAELADAGLVVTEFGGGVLFEPGTLRNRQGGPFQVFTPFWRTCLTREVAPPLASRRGELAVPGKWPPTLPLEALALRPKTGERWDQKFYAEGHDRVSCEDAREDRAKVATKLATRSAADRAADARVHGGHDQSAWKPGEAGARERLRAFVRSAISDYDTRRELPAINGTSMLSPHLHFGEVSPRQIWTAVRALGRDSGVFPPNNGAAIFLKELGWREFGYHLLWHFSRTPEQPLREAFARFPWRKDPGGRLLRAWQRGRTGYPIVDAGMRQLWRTGWMHNRVRMIVASFLVKHLRLPWTAGAAYFWDTLLDADLANNTLGWQWTAGCGADAAPYFRIFAPVAQGEKFDANGEYVPRWVPELASVPTELIHAPWTNPLATGVRLGEDYPYPIVDHATARQEALAAFQEMRARPSPR